MFTEGELVGDRFRVEKRLGKGGFGSAFLALDTLEKEQCVIKLLRYEKLLEEGYTREKVQELLVKEARQLRRVRCEGVPIFLGLHAFEHEGRRRRLMAQEFIEGRTLFDILRNEGPLSLLRAVKLLEDALSILRYLHEFRDKEGRLSPLLHLDIDPYNMMLRESDGRLFLIDFGVSVQVAGKNGRESVFSLSMAGYGKDGYFAPEVPKRRPCTGSDLYSLAMSFLVLHSGRSATELDIALEEGQCFGVLVPLPEALTLLLQHMLEPKVSKRLQSAREALARLQNIDWEELPPTNTEKKQAKKPERERSKEPLHDAESLLETDLRQYQEAKKIGKGMGWWLALTVVLLVVLVGVWGWWLGAPLKNGVGYAYNPGEQKYVKELGGNVRWIPPGTFWMGSPKAEKGRDGDEGPRHKVRISRGFWMMETEVTQAQFQGVMGYNPSYFFENGKCKDGKCPVESVSWHEAALFANKLSVKSGVSEGKLCFKCSGTGKSAVCSGVSGGSYVSCKGWRLPTEAEWEYAARAGTRGPFFTGNCLSTKQANYNGNYPYTGCNKGEYRSKTIVVGSLVANGWGLYDMLGNVWEWNYDYYHKNWYKRSLDAVGGSGDTVLDPVGSSSSPYHVLRGGSWGIIAWFVRSADRVRNRPTFRDDSVGFRLVRVE